MKKILIILIGLGIIVQLSAEYEDGSGFFVQVGGGFALIKPYNSKLSDGVFAVDSFYIEPEQFSKAMNNDNDTYLMLGANFPVENALSVIIGVRAHAREGVNHEFDILGTVSKQFSKNFSAHIGGGFGAGNLDIAFNTVTFTNGDVIDYPNDMDFQTAYCHLGLGYKITNNWSLITTYEIKEISVDGDDLKEQINWNDVSTIGIINSISSYESTTHTVYLSLRYIF